MQKVSEFVAMELLAKKLYVNITTTTKIETSYRTSMMNNKNMLFAPNHNQSLATALMATNITNPHHNETFHQTAISLAYSGYRGMKLAPWLTGIIFALVVFVILIPAFCSACYHYYR